MDFIDPINSKPETRDSRLSSRMHGLQKPFGGNLPADPRLPRSRQHLAADRGELQTETDVVAEAADRVVFCAAGMLAVDQLGQRWEIPDGAVFARERVLPPFGDIGDRLLIEG